MKFYGELLVFVLLFITNLRVFFVHHVRRDPLVVLAPFTFVVAILQVYAWGIDPFNAMGLIIAFFVLLSNFHAIFRYMERLYVDHYSALMKIWAAFTIIISAIALAASIYFVPVERNKFSYKTHETKVQYKGSFRSGFEKAGPFDSISLTLYEYAPINQPEETDYQNPIILLSPDKRADTANYRPYLENLASRGFTACSADFFAEDGRWLHSFADKKILRRTFLVFQSIINKQAFTAQKEYYSYNIAQEYSVLIPLLQERYGSDRKIFLVTDFMAEIAAEDLQKKNPEIIADIFNLTSIEEYRTAGYGCVEQTEPLLATFLGSGRDGACVAPNLMSARTLERLELLKVKDAKNGEQK